VFCFRFNGLVFYARRVMRALLVCGSGVYGLRCHECDNRVKVKWISSILALERAVFSYSNCRPRKSSPFLPYVYSLSRTVFFSLSHSPTPFLSVPSCCHHSTHITCIIFQTPFSYPRAKDREPQTESEQRIMRCDCCSWWKHGQCLAAEKLAVFQRICSQ
jgi:hypothetical protein